MEILSTWRRGAEGVGRGGEGRARQLPWAVSELPVSAGWGGDDFTPQKCLNQENNPTWDAAGRQAVEWGECGLEISVGTRGQDRWLATTHCGPWLSLIVLGFQERNVFFFYVASEITEPGLERDSRLDSGLQP